MSRKLFFFAFWIGFFSTLTGLWVLGSRQAFPVAAQNTVLVSIDPVHTALTAGSESTVDIKLSGGQNIGSYQFTLSYNPAVITVKAVQDSGWLASTGRAPIPVLSIDNSTGKTTFGAYSTGSQTGPDGNDSVLATITLQAVADGTSALSLTNPLLTDPSGLNSISLTTTEADITVGVNNPTPAPTPTGAPTPTLSPTPTPTPPPGGVATFTLALTKTPVFEGEEFDANFNFQTNEAVSGLDAIILFDPTKLSAVSLTDKHLLPLTPKTDINNGNGKIMLSQLAQYNQPFLGSGTVATIKFRALNLAENKIGFDFLPDAKTESNAISAANGNNILAQPADLTFIVTDHALLSVKLTTPSENAAIGHTVSGTLSVDQSSWTSQLQTDPTGLSNTINIDNFVNQLTTFTLKVSGYLRRKFTLTPLPGANTADLGKLKAGDLNDDRIINNIDLSLQYDQWFGSGSADLNHDGIVNSADYWIILSNFLQTDE